MSETTTIGYAKPRPPWAVGCGPDWRIVSNGKRYRVERRTMFRRKVYEANGDTFDSSTETWEPVKDYDPPHPHIALARARAKLPPNNFSVFETRFLWRARWRMHQEIREAKERKRNSEWVEVER